MPTTFLAPAFYAMALAAGLGLFIHSLDARQAGFGADESYMYPLVILFLWITFAIISLLQSVLKKNEPVKGNLSLLLYAALCIGFLCFAMVPLGFILASLSFFLLYCLLLGYRKPLVVASYAAGATLGLWFMFEKFLEIPLPQGLLEYII